MWTWCSWCLEQSIWVGNREEQKSSTAPRQVFRPRKQRSGLLTHLAAWLEPAWTPRCRGRLGTRLHLGHWAILPPGSSRCQNHWPLPCSVSARRVVATASPTALCAAASLPPRRRRTQRSPSVQFAAGAHLPLTRTCVSHTTAQHAGSPGWSGKKWSSWCGRGCPPGTPATGCSSELGACSLQRSRGERREWRHALLWVHANVSVGGRSTLHSSFLWQTIWSRVYFRWQRGSERRRCTG